MKKLRLLIPMICLLGMCACKNEGKDTKAPVGSVETAPPSTSSEETSETTQLNPPAITAVDSYDEASDIIVNMSSNTTVSNNNGGVVIEENIVWILKEGSYVLKGTLDGQVIVSAPEEEVELSLDGATIICDNACPLLIYEAKECEISSKSGTDNIITDLRDEETDSFSAAIYSNCDLKLKGKGTLDVANNYNNGIHSKDDLEIKNLTLRVKAINNAIKGNDSLIIESGNVTAISTQGDAIKTDNSDISSKGNQRGTITISGGELNLYAACDCIEASYDVVIDNDPIINCVTDLYSKYSEEVSAKASGTLYLRLNQNISGYRYAVLFTLDDNKTVFQDAALLSTSNMGPIRRESYLSCEIPENATALQIYVYNSTTTQNSKEDYLYASENIYLNDAYDCLNVSLVNSSLSLSWSTYQTMQGPAGNMPGGMNDGNNDKAEYSCKGIKACNEINIAGGTINIKSHDDAIHANGDVSLENGNIGLGNVNITGGDLTIYTDDDGIHADNKLNISGGYINITKSYEGLEANVITIDGGCIELISSDDGVNASVFSESPCIYMNSGVLYLNSQGDGIDSNGSVFVTGGYIIALGPSNGGNGVLDFDGKFSATGGYVLAIGASGMNQSIKASGDASSFTKSISTSNGSYVSLVVDGEIVATIKVLKSGINYCVCSYVGTSASIDVSSSSSETLKNDLYYVNN